MPGKRTESLVDRPRVGRAFMHPAKFEGALGPSGGSASDETMLAEINALAQVQETLTAEDVIVRGMWLMNDQPMHENPWFIRKFDAAAVIEAQRFVNAKPVLVNHSTYGFDGLPVGRFFRSGVVADRKDAPGTWLWALFYMLTDDQGAMLDRKIMGGLISEVSPTIEHERIYCSICGAEDLDCEHIPGELYEGVKCYAVMTGILDVWEGSLAWAGMQKNTSLYVAAGREGRFVETESVMRAKRERKAAPARSAWDRFWRPSVEGSPGT